MLGTLAGATAVCLTNDNVRTTLGIGSEPLQSEKQNIQLYSKTTFDID